MANELFSDRINAARYAAGCGYFGSRSAYANYLIGMMNLRDDPIAIDIGTGNGVLSAELAKRYPRAAIIGVDPSKELINFANYIFGLCEIPDNLQSMELYPENISRFMPHPNTHDLISYINQERKMLGGGGYRRFVVASANDFLKHLEVGEHPSDCITMGNVIHWLSKHNTDQCAGRNRDYEVQCFQQFRASLRNNGLIAFYTQANDWEPPTRELKERHVTRHPFLLSFYKKIEEITGIPNITAASDDYCYTYPNKGNRSELEDMVEENGFKIDSMSLYFLPTTIERIMEVCVQCSFMNMGVRHYAIVQELARKEQKTPTDYIEDVVSRAFEYSVEKCLRDSETYDEITINIIASKA